MVESLIIIALLAWAWKAYYSDDRKVLRRLKKVQSKHISELKDGEIGKIVGRVVFGKSVLNAPISGRKCAYFRVTIEKYHSSNSDSGTDVLLDEHEFGEIIVFEENHYALIDLSNVKISVEADCFEEWNKFQSAPKAVAEFLASKGMTSNISMDLFDSLSCTEAVISEGKELVVAGKGYWADVAELGLDIPAQRILVMKPGEDGVVFVDCH